MYRELFALWNEDIVALTVNRRLSQEILRQYGQYQLSQQKTVWETPTVLPLDAWLTFLWQHHPHAQGLLLSEFQERVLWQRILCTESVQDDAWILQSLPTASLAAEAWYLLKRWDLSMQVIEETAHPEILAFVTWTKCFQQIQATQGYLSIAELPKAVDELIQTDTIQLPSKIFLLGFDEFQPTVQRLINHLQQRTTLQVWNPPPRQAQLQRIQCPDLDTELLTMARWAKAHHEKHPQQKIGCLIPNLTALRKPIIRIFTEVFAPQGLLPSLSSQLLPFNLSAGQRLDKFPMIQSALAILQIHPTKIPFEILSLILRSPYCNYHDAEVAMATQVELHIREQHGLQINKKSLLALLHRSQPHFPSATLAHRWTAFLKTPQQVVLLPSQWAIQFQQNLTNLGWPGQRPLSSNDYQLKQRWEKVLSELAELDFLCHPLSHQEAYALLSSLVQSVVFQSESPEVPIQIWGLLEAGGSQWDHLWIMGLDDENWPPPAHPNPLLPFFLQRQQRMPHASAQRELEYAERLQQHLFQQANHVILSSAQYVRDTHHLSSQLIQSIPRIEIDALSLPPYQSNLERVFRSSQLEYLPDAEALPLQAHEHIRGGSRILQEQALCPFRAFAAIRLQAHPLITPQWGLRAKERGTIVHAALEWLWETLQTQEKLQQYSVEKLQPLIQQAIETTIKRYSRQHPSFFLRVEKKRLSRLLYEWLLLEKKRPPFRVAQRESVHALTIGPLTLTLKMDRVDLLSDGAPFIIDYKTTTQNAIQDWFGERPRHLQLPLYCAYVLPSAAGLAYAEIQSGKLAMKGLLTQHADPTQCFSQVIPLNQWKGQNDCLDWEQMLTHWRRVLTQLSYDFHGGKAAVNPLDKNTTCQYCDLHALCRIGSSLCPS